MDGEKPVVTPAQAAHESEMQRHRNGAINLAKPIPEFAGKVLGPWKVRAPQDGPGMVRYAQSPGITAEERAAMEPPPTAERRQLEPWNYQQYAGGQPEAEITDDKAAKAAARAQMRNETEQSIGQGQERGNAR